MGKTTSMCYKGPSRDIAWNPWLRLVHGKRYEIEKSTKLKSGHIRVRITNGRDVGQILYKSKREFDKDWC